MIFFVEENYKYLTRLVERNFKKYGITIIAYCFMPNHYHFLLRLETELLLSKFINVLFNTYVQALNRQQNRTGALFEGRFKHILVDEWKYLIHLCRYIHLNPVKAGLVSTPEEWAYSNYKVWIGARNGILKDDNFIQGYFESRERYSEFVNDIEDEKQNLVKIRKYIWD